MLERVESVTFVASRAKLISGAIALGVGTAAITTMFLRLLAAALSSPNGSAVIFVLILFGALISLFVYIDFKLVMALVKPTSLTISRDGISLSQNGQIVAERWDNLGDPQAEISSIGQGGRIASIVFMRGDEDGFKVRSDIYPQTPSQILTAIEDAMAQRQIEQPVPPSQFSNYLIIVYSAILSAGLAYYVWRR